MSDKTTAFDGDENAFEVFYRLQLTGSIVVTPDFQYISNPSGNNTIDDAVTANVRIQINF
jgi:carbohydrate-selective porin OprB